MAIYCSLLASYYYFMSGHSHWAGIKHQKEITDKKRGVVFSKLLMAVSAAAKTDPDPNFNPRLRTAIETAEKNNVPAENISRAIKRAKENADGAEELLFESYGPAGVGILIYVITSNSNRAVSEIKSILTKTGARWADPGSVKWAFEAPKTPGEDWLPKHLIPMSEVDAKKLFLITDAIEAHDDVQKIFTNAE